MRRLTNPRSLARAIRAAIEAEDHWNQSIWLSAAWFPQKDDDEWQRTGTELRKFMTANVCGTTACVAGHAVILTMPTKARYDYLRDSVINEDGTHVFVQDYAQAALGITMSEADWLFSASRSKEEVLKALDLLAAGQPVSSLFPRWY